MQKKKIAEYRQKKRQTEELLANANYVDFEDFENSEGEEDHLMNDKDKLEGYVEELSRDQGRKRAPPAVN